MSQILVLGAGFVAGPLVKYLTKRNHSITVASQFIEEAAAIAKVYPSIKITELNVADEQALGELVKQHDLVISFIPYQFHINVAKQCIQYTKHMITASYETPEIKALNQQALDKGITILNEIGLDPGIDHLSAMQIINEIKEQGGTLNSFVSWCGGLPAPQSNNNPLGYKFAWAPQGALLALLNEAVYLKDGQVVTISEQELLNDIQSIEISSELTLEGYPNRDSVSYRTIYGIEDADEVFRGTLRYAGFSAIFQCCKELGLLETGQSLLTLANMTWRQLLEENTENLESYLNKQSTEVVEAISWLGLLDNNQIVSENNSVIDAFCVLLMEKLAYAEGEQDMVVLQHQFKSTNAKGESETRYSTLILEGDVGGYSAMSKTVGTPAAIAADLILDNTISKRGVILPMSSDIYNPMLKALSDEDITLIER